MMNEATAPEKDLPPALTVRLLHLLGSQGRRELGRQPTCASSLGFVTFNVLGRAFRVVESHIVSEWGNHRFTFTANTDQWELFVEGWRTWNVVVGEYRFSILETQVTNREALERDLVLLEMAEGSSNA